MQNQIWHSKNLFTLRFVTLLVAASLILGAAFSAHASPRDETIEQLRALEIAWPGQDVRVSVPTSGGSALRIGDDLKYAFESGSAGYLTAVHIDTHGATTLLYPRANVAAGKIGAGQTVQLPAENDGFTLEAQPPVGRDFVYAIVSEKPITRQDLGISSSDIVVSFEAHQAPSFLRRLKSVLTARARGEVKVAHVMQQVEGRGDVQYRSIDIVNFFGERTRSIRPPKLDLQIQFSSGSATLDQGASRNVAEFAKALKDPKLLDTRFKVSGHTDDVGSPEANKTLSRRRAEAVRKQLIDQGGVDPKRLEIEAHGEMNLLMKEQTPYARKMNRRVDFTPAR